MVKINKQGCRGKYGNAKTGIFKPQNREKYLSFETPIYKSKLELLFMRYLDKSQNVKWWKYEPNHILYMDHSTNPPQKRKYFIDFIFATNTNPEQIYWVEIKPYSESVPPKTKNPRDLKIWIKNQCKWKAAKILAESKGIKFKVLTEKELK